MRDLDPHYHVSEPPNPLHSHLVDTIAALGGIYGLIGILIGIFVFYGIVVFAIDRSRAKQQAKKK